MGKYKYENTGKMPVNSRAKVKVEFSSGTCSEDQAADLNWSLVEYGLSNIVSWEYVNPNDDPSNDDDDVPFPPHMFYWQQPTRKPNPDLAILVEVELHSKITEKYAASRLYDFMTENEDATKSIKRWRYTEEPVVEAKAKYKFRNDPTADVQQWVLQHDLLLKIQWADGSLHKMCALGLGLSDGNPNIVSWEFASEADEVYYMNSLIKPDNKGGIVPKEPVRHKDLLALSEQMAKDSFRSARHTAKYDMNIAEVSEPYPSYVRQLAKLAIDTIDQRGKDYDSPTDGERSGPAIAAAFSAITGKSITPAEVYLLHSITKSVRQWQCPDRHHTDSGIDRVAYDLLIDEALHLQFATSPTDEDERDE